MSVAKREDITTRSVRAKLRLDALPRQRNVTQFDSGDYDPQPSRIPVRSDTLPSGLHARAATETPRSVSDSNLRHARLGTSPGPAPASPRAESPALLTPRARSPENALPPPPPPPKDADRESWISIARHHEDDDDEDREPPSPTMTIPTIPDDGHSYYRDSTGRPSFALSQYSEASKYSQSTSTLHTDWAQRQQQRLPPLPVPTPLPRGVTLPRKSLEERQREIEEKRERERREGEELLRREQEEQEARRRARAEQIKRYEEEEEHRRRQECVPCRARRTRR